MARIRSIKPAFFTSEDTCGCSPLARLLFLGLLTEADRAGRLEDKPRQIKRRLLPDDACDIDALIEELADRRLIHRYTTMAVAVLQITNFEKHQRPHPKEPASLLPAEEPCKNTANREKVINHPVEYPSRPARNGSGDLGSGDLCTGDLGTGDLVAAVVTAFDRFWQAYPKKTGKGAASKAWAKAKPPIEAVLAALAWQRTQPAWVKDAGDYIPNPATWLNQRRWEDEPFQAPPTQAEQREADRERARAYTAALQAIRDARDVPPGPEPYDEGQS